MSKFTKLLELSDYADAKVILETLPANESRSTLAMTAYQIKESQPNLARNFLKTIIKECEDEEKIKEVDGGQSHESSSTTGLSTIGKDDGDGEKPVNDVSDPKDQMGVAIGEMAPPMGVPPQQPPQQQPPQIPQQQMQYTIQEAQAIRGQFTAIKEAITALTKQIQETQLQATKSLTIGNGNKGEKLKSNFIRETVDENKSESIKRMNDALNKGTY